jgi:hypothetical protein
VGVKKLTAPLTLTISRGVEREEKKGLNNTPHFYSLPQGERRIREIFFKNFLPIC